VVGVRFSTLLVGRSVGGVPPLLVLRARLVRRSITGKRKKKKKNFTRTRNEVRTAKGYDAPLGRRRIESRVVSAHTRTPSRLRSQDDDDDVDGGPMFMVYVWCRLIASA